MYEGFRCTYILFYSIDSFIISSYKRKKNSIEVGNVMPSIFSNDKVGFVNRFYFSNEKVGFVILFYFKVASKILDNHMGNSKSKKISIEMKLRSGTEYNLPENQGNHNISGMSEAIVSSGDAAFVRSDEEVFVPTNEERAVVQYKFTNAVRQVVRLLPAIIGGISIISVVAEYFFGCDVQINEIEVHLVQRRGWLYDYLFGPEETVQKTYVTFPTRSWWK